MSIDKIDFIQLANILFRNRSKYNVVTDEDKTYNFYIINLKLALNYLKQCQALNSKFIDTASAIDLWYLSLRKYNEVPWWWFQKSQKIKEKKEKTPDKKLILMYNDDLTDSDYEFLLKYKKDKLEDEIQRLKKFDI
jgi:hypothetical protein